MAFVSAGSATDYLDLLDQLIQFAAKQTAVSATVAAGGTGYTVSDTLTLVGGTFTTAATFNVDTVSGGVVTSVSVVAVGDYTETPVDPVATTGGTGTGATLNVTFNATNGWKVRRRQATSNPPNEEVILEGEGSGADEIFMGIQSTDDATHFNWDLRGFSGFQAIADFDLQPGVSPAGSIMILANQTITFWFFVNSRRIMVIARIGSTYTNLHMGFMNPFATSVEYPYPLLIMGCSDTDIRLFSDSVVAFSGMVDPISTGTTLGPGFVRNPGGTWQGIVNSLGEAGRVAKEDVVVWPAGNLSTTGFGAGSFKMRDRFIPSSGSPGSPTNELHQTPETPNFVSKLVPATVIESTPADLVLGEMDNVFWVSGHTETGFVTSEDTFALSGDTFIAFQNCNRTDPWAFFAIKEE